MDKFGNWSQLTNVVSKVVKGIDKVLDIQQDSNDPVENVPIVDGMAPVEQSLPVQEVPKLNPDPPETSRVDVNSSSWNSFEQKSKEHEVVLSEPNPIRDQETRNSVLTVKLDSPDIQETSELVDSSTLDSSLVSSGTIHEEPSAEDLHPHIDEESITTEGKPSGEDSPVSQSSSSPADRRGSIDECYTVASSDIEVLRRRHAWPICPQVRSHKTPQRMPSGNCLDNIKTQYFQESGIYLVGDMIDEMPAHYRHKKANSSEILALGDRVNSMKRAIAVHQQQNRHLETKLDEITDGSFYSYSNNFQRLQKQCVDEDMLEKASPLIEETTHMGQCLEKELDWMRQVNRDLLQANRLLLDESTNIVHTVNITWPYGTNEGTVDLNKYFKRVAKDATALPRELSTLISYNEYIEREESEMREEIKKMHRGEQTQITTSKVLSSIHGQIDLQQVGQENNKDGSVTDIPMVSYHSQENMPNGYEDNSEMIQQCLQKVAEMEDRMKVQSVDFHCLRSERNRLNAAYHESCTTFQLWQQQETARNNEAALRAQNAYEEWNKINSSLHQRIRYLEESNTQLAVSNETQRMELESLKRDLSGSNRSGISSEVQQMQDKLKGIQRHNEVLLTQNGILIEQNKELEHYLRDMRMKMKKMQNEYVKILCTL